MRKKYTIVGIAGIFLILVGTFATLIMAQETVGEGPSRFDLGNWFKKTFGISTFSVVGDSRQCDRYPVQTLRFNYNSLMNIKVSDYSSSSYGLIDVYRGDWSTIGEWKDAFTATCGSATGCIAEVYSCPHPECTSDSQCVGWYGSHSMVRIFLDMETSSKY